MDQGQYPQPVSALRTRALTVTSLTALISPDAQRTLQQLPLWSQQASFASQLADPGPLLVEAEPGAGKSTLVPLWALASASDQQQVWLIQPRILATRAVANRLAKLAQSRIGALVGYQVPYERRLDADTRLQVMTPGIFLQRLLNDPELSGVHTVMLDEIHERTVELDLAWAWLQESQILRDDLNVIAMTATPDPRLQAAVPNRLIAPGRQFPVDTIYQPAKANETVAEQVKRALLSHSTDHATILVFLPGWREIQTCQQVLTESLLSHRILRLHSRVPDDEQQAALSPETGHRIILSTNIAETSLTVPDVTLVVDTGLARVPRLTQSTGVTRLHTQRISQASADQRRGRAGRVQAGTCLRLWSANDAMTPVDRPEITRCDALLLALRLAHWGSREQDLAWLDAPPAQALINARQTLRQWGLITDATTITANGITATRLGAHPRVATYLLAHRQVSDEPNLPADHLWLALALHFDFLPETGSDDWLTAAQREYQHNRQWQWQAKRWLRTLNGSSSESDQANFDAQPDQTPLLLALSDRIGHRQASGRYRLSTGISVRPLQPLSSEWACFPMIRPDAEGHAGFGLPVELDQDSRKQYSVATSTLKWQSGRWLEDTVWTLGDQVITTERYTIEADHVPARLIHYLQSLPIQHHAWPKSALNLLSKARLAQRQQLLELPELSDDALLNQLHDWLLPFLTASSRLERLPWLEGLKWYLGHANGDRLQEQLPDSLKLASGRRCTIQYEGDHAPSVTSKLQDFFGTQQLSLGNGRIPVTAILLSPAQRPLAVTADLASFWEQVYPQVRKEMRGRYPKHPWPELPGQSLG